MKRFSSNPFTVMLLLILMIGLGVTGVIADVTDYTIRAASQLIVGGSTNTDAEWYFTPDSARGSTVLQLDGQLKLNSTVLDNGNKFSTIDSFTTTALLDTVVFTGVASGDLVLVAPLTTLASATPDSGYQYYGYILNTDSVVVGRIADAADNNPKSAGIYSCIVVHQ